MARLQRYVGSARKLPRTELAQRRWTGDKMNTRLPQVLAFGLLTCLVSACCLHTSLLLRNESGQKISVYSSHTKQTHVINDHSTGDIPHTMGELSITSSTGIVWTYQEVSVPSLDQAKYLKHGRKGLFAPSVTLKLLLQRDGALYYLPPDASQETNYLILQPSGFPLYPKQKLLTK